MQRALDQKMILPYNCSHILQKCEAYRAVDFYVNLQMYLVLRHAGAGV